MKLRAVLGMGLLVSGVACTQADTEPAEPGAPAEDASAGSDAASVSHTESDAGTLGGKIDMGGPPSSASNKALRLNVFPKGFRVSSPTASPRFIGNKRVDPNQANTPQERSDQIAQLLGGETYEDCGVMLGALMGGPMDVQCYGPNLDYKNHPDALSGPTDGQLPHGDLGMWTETEGPSQACAAAKLNSLIETLGRKVDFGLYAAASLVCTGSVSGKLATGDVSPSTDPDGGVAADSDAAAETASADVIEALTKVDLTEEFATVLAINPGLTVNEASLERLADDGDLHVYHYVVDVSVPGQPQPRVVHTEILHKSNPASPGTYWGRIWGLASGGGDEAYSVTYARNADAKTLRSRALAANYDKPQTTAAVFDADGLLRLQSDWSGNMTQAVFELDADSSTTGNVSFAWQAGRGDSHARVFNVHTELDAQVLSGCGFFGYGPRFDATQAAYPDNSIQTFICNWAGPNNDHLGKPGFAQKQCMMKDGAGAFVPTSSALSYAPVNSCSSTGTSFEYKLQSETTYSSAPLESALIELANDADYQKYRAPMAP